MNDVVTFPKVNLQDIPAKLRELADNIEKGDLGQVTTTFVIIPQESTKGWPVLFGYGDNADAPDFIFQMEQAKFWLVKNIVRRA